MQRLERGADYKKQNPWWKTGDVSTSTRYVADRRSDYHFKLNSVRSSRFTVLAGAAGSGKTTMLHQIAHDLIEEDDVPPENIMYLPLGDPQFQVGSEVIREAVDQFATYYWRQDADPGDGFILIDDAHASRTWSKQVRWCLKEFDKLTVAVTLPSLNRAEIGDIDELDVDIAEEFLLPPKFYDVMSESGRLELKKETARDTRDALEVAADSGDTEPLRSVFKTIEASIDSTNTAKRSVLDYFRGAGRDSDGRDVALSLESTIYRDIPRYQQFEERSDLYALCAIAAMHSGRTIGLKDLSGVLECDRRTLQRYIDILEDFLIMTPSYQYEFKRRRSVRLYIRDPLLVASLADLDLSGMLDPDTERRMMSAVVFDHLKRLAFHYQGGNPPVHFWDSGREGVDFVIETEDGNPLPIVLQHVMRNRDPTESIREFCDEHDCEFGVTIARDIEPSIEKGVARFPLWMFLLIV